jgi:Flp pilus assembly pilin Flp
MGGHEFVRPIQVLPVDVDVSHMAGSDERAETNVGRSVPGGPVPAPEAERGAALVEYALLIALIVLVCIAAMELLGGVTQGIFSSAASDLG